MNNNNSSHNLLISLSALGTFLPSPTPCFAERKVPRSEKEIKKLWDLRCAKVSPEVIGALGSVTKDLECWIENMDIVPEVGVLQKTALLGTARILRKVLEL